MSNSAFQLGDLEPLAVSYPRKQEARKGRAAADLCGPCYPLAQSLAKLWSVFVQTSVSLALDCQHGQQLEHRVSAAQRAAMPWSLPLNHLGFGVHPVQATVTA